MESKKIFISIILIMIASCTPSNDGGSNGINSEYRTGTQGLTMNFISEVPPDTVYNTYPLNVMIEYSNKGASPIDNGMIYLSGFDTEYVPLGPTPQQLEYLPGKNIYDEKGLMAEIAEFHASSVDVRDIQEIDSFDQTIKATACYEYHTYAYPLVCIDPTLGRGTVSEGVCTVRDVTLSGGQGAPIAVTKVEQEMVTRSSGTRVVFKLTVKNVGNGQPFAERDRSINLNNCHSELTYRNIDNIVVSQVSISNVDFTCTPDVIRLDGNTGYTICDGSSSALGSDAYETPLSIHLMYGYSTSISKDIKIVNFEGS